MAQTAAHLVDRVFPIAPVRQWVLSLPFRLRYRIAYDSKLMAEVLRIFMQAVSTDLCARGKALYNVEKPQTGAVTVVQRFGSALNLNCHFHAIFIDGIYAAGASGKPELYELPAPQDADVERVAGRIAEQVEARVRRFGLEDESDPLSENEPGMATMYAGSLRWRIAAGANIGKRVEMQHGDRIDGDSLAAMKSRRCAGVNGFNLHANVEIGAFDRSRLERLLRYAARPALAGERLSQLEDGRLRYELKRPWSSGETAVVFEPLDFLSKLAALVPAPRVHRTRFFGILAPAAKWRKLVIPDPPLNLKIEPPPTPSDSGSAGANPEPEKKKPNYTWASPLMRVFAVDVLKCPVCHNPTRILAAIHPPENTRKILDCRGLPSRAPPVTPAVHVDDEYYQ